MKRLLPLVLLLCMQGASMAQVFATVDEVSGPVRVLSEDGSSTAATVGRKIQVGQTIVTQANAELHATTEDGGLIAVRPNSVFKVTRYQADQGSAGVVEMTLLKGALRSITGWIGKLNPRGYRLSTSTATVGIRGTDHETTVIETDSEALGPAGTYDTVLEGATTVRTEHGELPLEAGQHGFAPRAAREAPRLLTERPRFLRNRLLRLEDRIPARKQKLQERLRQFLKNHPEHAEALREKLVERRAERKALREQRREAHHPAHKHPAD
jgi:hypothetical protein